MWSEDQMQSKSVSWETKNGAAKHGKTYGLLMCTFEAKKKSDIDLLGSGVEPASFILYGSIPLVCMSK